MDDETVCTVALTRLAGAGPITVRRLIDSFGSARAALDDARPHDLLALPNVPERAVDEFERLSRGLGALEEELAQLEATGVCVLLPGCEGYPARIARLSGRPAVLYARGELPAEYGRTVGIVGSTHPSAKGAGIAREFAQRLAQRGATVVSGYAPGIDSAAHLGALEGGGRTVMMLPTGIAAFARRVEFAAVDEFWSRTTVFSESAPDAPWSVGAALARNRLIAAMSDAVLAVEAREEGGTMNTAMAARETGVPLFVVRYRRYPASAAGNESAIALGGVPVTSYSQIDALLEPRSADAQRLEQREFEW